jgi:release factor glutamine methyltransferase
VLLAHTLGIDRAHLLADLWNALSPEQTAAFDVLLARRQAREPLAYIIGHREFYGIEIVCSPAALIPRPESEMLVDLALDEAGRRRGEIRIVDVGTGSGAIAIAIAMNAPSARVLATDVSDATLALARPNIERHGVESRVELGKADLLDGLGVFDVIVANLPYVSERDWRSLAPELRDHEPKTALVGGETGTEIIEAMLRQAPPHLAPGGVLAAEIGDTQGAAVLRTAREAFPEAAACVMKDLAGLDRMLVVRT